MKLGISSNELSEFIKDFTKKDITAQIKSGYLELTIDLDFKLFTKSCTFIIEEIEVELETSNVIISYSSKTLGLDWIVSGLLQLGNGLRDEYEKLEGNKVKLFLSKIEKLREPLSKIKLISCAFLNNEIIVNFNIKKS